jgi:hypothetical protein
MQKQKNLGTLGQMLAQRIGSSPTFELQLIVDSQIKRRYGFEHNGNLLLLIHSSYYNEDVSAN